MLPTTSILLVGAPSYQACTQRSTWTVTTFSPAFEHFVNAASVVDEDAEARRKHKGIEDAGIVSTALTNVTASAPVFAPAWRLLKVEREHLRTGLSQRAWLGDGYFDMESPLAGHGGGGSGSQGSYDGEEEVGYYGIVEDGEEEGTTFFSIMETGGPLLFDKERGGVELNGDKDVEEFLSTSYARYAEQSGHQKDRSRRRSISSRTTISTSSSSPSPCPSYEEGASFLTTTSSSSPTLYRKHTAQQHPPDSSLPLPTPQVRKYPSAPHLLHLSALPSANQIQRINPQTITADLIAAVISVAPPRIVTLRRKGAQLAESQSGQGQAGLVEVCLGDETRAGFCVTFWVPAESQNIGSEYLGDPRSGGDDLRERLARLRPGDVVLMKNVELNQFRNKVQGQSMRKRSKGWETTFQLLYRRGVCRQDVRVGGDRDHGLGGEIDVVYDSDDFDDYDAEDDDDNDNDGYGSTVGSRKGPKTTKRELITQHLTPQEKLVLAKVARVKSWVARFVGGAFCVTGVKRSSSVLLGVGQVQTPGIHKQHGRKRRRDLASGDDRGGAGWVGAELPPDETPVR